MKGAKKREPLEEQVFVRMSALDRRAGLIVAEAHGFGEADFWRRLMGQRDGKYAATEWNQLSREYQEVRAKLRGKEVRKSAWSTSPSWSKSGADTQSHTSRGRN